MKKGDVNVQPDTLQSHPLSVIATRNKVSNILELSDSPSSADSHLKKDDNQLSFSPTIKKLMRYNTRKLLPGIIKEANPSQSSEPNNSDNPNSVPENKNSNEAPPKLTIPLKEVSNFKSDLPSESPFNANKLRLSSINSVTPSSAKHSLSNLIQKKFNKLQPIPKVSEDEEDFAEDIDFEVEQVLIKFPFGIISPYGYFKKFWDMCMIIMLVYIGIILPVRLCFLRIPENMFAENYDYIADDAWFPYDIAVDCLLVLDIIINFLSAFENEAGILIHSRREIAKAYLKKWFLVDLISAIPINQTIYRVEQVDMNDPEFNFDLYKAWRICRLIKLIRIIKINSSIERLFSLMTLDLDRISITKSITSILLFIHITACIWNLEAELQATSSWYLIEIKPIGSIFERYLTTLYFSLTVLLTIGYGNIYPYTIYEKLISIAWMFFGIIVYAYIISSLTSSFAKMNQAKNENEEKDFFFRYWAKVFHLPYETLEMILATIDTKQSSSSARKMQALNAVSKTLTELPKGLYTEIYNYVFREILEKVEFFQKQPKHFLIKLMPLLTQTNFHKGDLIYRYGDPSLEIFFIVKGRVISKCQDAFGKERTQVFVEGSLFGEVDIIMKRSRTVSMRAETDVELWKVNKKEFLDLLNEFPEIKEEVERLARIKEFYRTPQGPTYQKKTPMTHLKSNYYFQDIDPYASTDIFSALSSKMINKIKKGSYLKAQSRKEYESLDFEPDIPSPEHKVGLEVLSEAEWSEWENDITRRLMRKARKQREVVDELEISEKLQMRQQQMNTGIKLKMLQKYSDPNKRIRRGSVPAKPGSDPNMLADWEVQFRAKRKFLDELKTTKKVEFTDTSDIDRIIYGKEKLSQIKSQLNEKTNDVFDSLDKMIEQAQQVLKALDTYEESLNDGPVVYDLEKDNREN